MFLQFLEPGDMVFMSNDEGGERQSMLFEVREVRPSDDTIAVTYIDVIDASVREWEEESLVKVSTCTTRSEVVCVYNRPNNPEDVVASLPL